MSSFGIGISEVLALLILGPGKVPDIARGLGKALRQFDKYSSGLTSQFRDEFEKELSATPNTRSESITGTEERGSQHRSTCTETEGVESQNRS